MSDFIFSTHNIKEYIITERIQSIYKEDKPAVKEFHGDWGSLGVSRNLYNGFEPYETEEFISIIIGGPILEFRDNSFINHHNDSSGTKAIFNRWENSILRYDEDLNGPFVFLIINKRTSAITCITDLMSFIPVYAHKSEKDITLSTHVDALAQVTNQVNRIDEVSVADFILHGIVTYPYTTYTDIIQIAPATEHRMEKGSPNLEYIEYWIPKEIKGYKNVKKAARDIRSSLKNYVEKITNESTNIAQFISGGEDSRALSGLLKDYPRDAYIFLDQMNREGNIAKKVAKIYGANLKVHTRNKLHYLNILPNCSRLVGSGSQYHHAHTYGFHKQCKLNTNIAVFGGLFSDALLKGARIKKIKGTGIIPFLPDIKSEGYSNANQLTNKFVKKEILARLMKRRQGHLEYVKTFRSKSAEEWFELWPSSMNMNIPNMHANRRLFRTYEPFMSRKIVKISASVPQRWKLNRNLFQKAVKPLLKPTKWLIHGDGRLPYFPWYINIPIQFIIWFYRQIAKRIGLIKGNQGPWGEWSTLVKSNEWEYTLYESSMEFYKISSVFVEKYKKRVFENDGLRMLQNVNLMQVLYHLRK